MLRLLFYYHLDIIRINYEIIAFSFQNISESLKFLDKLYRKTSLDKPFIRIGSYFCFGHKKGRNRLDFSTDITFRCSIITIYISNVSIKESKKSTFFWLFSLENRRVLHDLTKGFLSFWSTGMRRKSGFRPGYRQSGRVFSVFAAYFVNSCLFSQSPRSDQVPKNLSVKFQGGLTTTGSSVPAIAGPDICFYWNNQL